MYKDCIVVPTLCVGCYHYICTLGFSGPSTKVFACSSTLLCFIVTYKELRVKKLQAMTKSKLISLTLLCVMLIACSKESGTDAPTPQTYNVSGVVEKGPFVSGSTISIQPLDEKMQSLGTLYNTTIKNNTGEFSFGSQEFLMPYAELTADGYFFNEIKGELSTGILRLRSVVNLSNSNTINVNILTHLKHPRILRLISQGVSFEKANKQAQSELLSAFGLQKYADKTDASQFSITSGNDEAAVLTAISALILTNRSEAQITEYLALLSDEFGRDGKFSTQSMKTIADDRKKIHHKLQDIEQNIINRYSELGREISVKDLYAYFDWDSDGEAGNELLKAGESVKLSEQKINAPAQGGKYEISINSPIPLYMEPMVESNINDEPMYDVSIQHLGLYEEGADINLSFETSLAGNTLSIDIAESRCRGKLSTQINLYDCIGNVVATLDITQDGNPTATIPQLGSDGQAVIANIARYLSQAYGKYNILEQSYHFNPLKLSDKIYTLSPIPLSAGNPDIEKAWLNFYIAIRNILQLKAADKSNLNVYQPYCNILLANIYYSMVVAWGDVPYFNDYQQYENNANSPTPRTAEKTILADLEVMLLEAIDYLDEKHNTPLKDANSLFFVSKDVARMTLANIYMYSNRHSEAIPLIEQVIANGFYTLSEDDFGDGENPSTATLNTLFEEDELIYGLRDGSGSRANIIILIPGTFAMQTITDAYLSLAECNLKAGKGTKANELINQVATAKNLTPTGDAQNKIYELRSKVLLYSTGYYPYMKRSGLAKEIFKVEEWQLLWPIPSSELNFNPNMTQNDGY